MYVFIGNPQCKLPDWGQPARQELAGKVCETGVAI